MTTPINIQTNKKYQACVEKCSYNFKYPRTAHLKITNENTNLLMNFSDKVDEKLTKVTYNNEDYNIMGIILLWPSVHNFNGKKMDGELIVRHMSSTGKILLVCVPIKKSEYSSAESLSTILDESSKLANMPNMSFSYQYDNFSLQDLIPEKPFYNYSLGDNGNFNIIVFDPINSITIDSTKFTDIFQKIIKQNYDFLPMVESIYYNDKGPNLEKLNDGIYISCNPTGESNDLVDISKPKNNVSFSTYNNTLMIFLKIIVGILLMVIVFACISVLFSYFSPKIKIVANSTANPN